jgi:SAM domain (Sterile alpha motif)
MDIESWLRSLGLERYEAAFRENEIDDTILPRLTAEDLKELGVGPLEHRRKLLEAIAALRADSNANAPLPAPLPAAPSIAVRATLPIVEAAGERRYLTVMFYDLVDSSATGRFTIYYGLWAGNIARGELGFAREIAETFLREAEREGRTTECGVGRCILGATCLWQGDFIEAQSNLVEALSIYDPERDRKARFRFGQDIGTAPRAYLANTKWQLGEVGRARALIEGAVAHAVETGHVPTLVNVYFFKAHFEIVRGDAGAARPDAEIVVKLSQENALASSWSTAIRLGKRSAWTAARPGRRPFDRLQRSDGVCLMHIAFLGFVQWTRCAVCSVIRMPASSLLFDVQKNDLRHVRKTTFRVVRSQASSGSGPSDRRLPYILGVRGAARSVSTVRQGEARTPRVPRGQPALYQAICLLRRPTLPQCSDPGCREGAQARLAYGERTGQAVHARPDATLVAQTTIRKNAKLVRLHRESVPHELEGQHHNSDCGDPARNSSAGNTLPFRLQSLQTHQKVQEEHCWTERSADNEPHG